MTYYLRCDINGSIRYYLYIAELTAAHALECRFEAQHHQSVRNFSYFNLTLTLSLQNQPS